MKRMENATRNKIQQSIEAGFITNNGKQVKSNHKVTAFYEIIVYTNRSPESTEVVPEKMDLKIVYEDYAVMVIDKPSLKNNCLTLNPMAMQWHG